MYVSSWVKGEDKRASEVISGWVKVMGGLSGWINEWKGDHNNGRSYDREGG